MADTAELVSLLTRLGTMVLLPARTVGNQFEDHRRPIDAAKDAADSRMVYTSCLGTAAMRPPRQNGETEAYLRVNMFKHTVLRDGWYLDSHLVQRPSMSKHGAILGAAKDGRLSAVSRSDYKVAAVTLGECHAGRTYDPSDAVERTMTQFAAALTEATDESIAYNDSPIEQSVVDSQRKADLPAGLAGNSAGTDPGLSRGKLLSANTDLRQMVARPTTSIADAAAVVLEAPVL